MSLAADMYLDLSMPDDPSSLAHLFARGDAGADMGTSEGGDFDEEGGSGSSAPLENSFRMRELKASLPAARMQALYEAENEDEYAQYDDAEGELLDAEYKHAGPASWGARAAKLRSSSLSQSSSMTAPRSASVSLGAHTASPTAAVTDAPVAAASPPSEPAPSAVAAPTTTTTVAATDAPSSGSWLTPFRAVQVLSLLMGLISSVNTARRSQILAGGLNYGDQCLNEPSVDGGFSSKCAALYTRVDFIDFSFALAAAGYGIIALPAVGRLSDRQGRKRWLVAAPLAMLLPPLNLLCITLPPHLVPLSVKHYFVYGFFACRTFAVTFDYTSLVMAELPLLLGPSDERTKSFSRIAAITLMTSCIGPVVGSFMPDMACTIVAATLALMASAWALTCLPHIRHPKPSSIVDPSAPRPSLCSDKGPLAPLLSIRILWSSWTFARVGLVVFCFRFLVYGLMEVSILSMRYRFGKGAATLYVGIVNAFFSFVASVLVEAIVPRLYMRRWNHKQIIHLGLFCYACASMLPVFVPETPWLLLPVLVLVAASIMVFPAISAYMSTVVPPEQQGRVFGAVGSIRLIGQACGPFALTSVLQLCTNSGDNVSYRNAFAPAYWSSLAWSPFAICLALSIVAILIVRTIVIKPPTKEQIEYMKAMMAARAGGGAPPKPPAPAQPAAPTTAAEGTPADSKQQLKVPLLAADQLSSDKQ